MALNAGARYVSLFWGRIRDVGYDAASIVTDLRDVMERGGSESEIIVGSIRQMIDVNEAFLAGATYRHRAPEVLSAALQPSQDRRGGRSVRHRVSEWMQ
jgi:transaldolase